MVSEPPLLAVVLVSYCSREDLARGLRALSPCRRRGWPVVVVDNASPDGSAELVAESFPWVRLICLERNHGFAVASNRGWLSVESRHVLFLNPDAILRWSALERALAVLESDPRAGAVSVRLCGDAGEPQVVAAELPTLAGMLRARLRRLLGRDPAREARREALRPAEDAGWLLGACLLVRGELLRRLGGFEERFFLYGEDLELGARIRAAGYRNRYLPEVWCYHRGNPRWTPDRTSRVHLALLEFFRLHRSRAAQEVLRGALLLRWTAALIAARLRRLGGGAPEAAGALEEAARRTLRRLAGRVEE
jgi:GT2 family glycosyltransferase